MTIRLHRGLEVANEITKRISDDMRILVTSMEITIDNYSNGREVGHALTYYNRNKQGNVTAICYAQNRNSDEIVVYFSDSTHLPSISDKAYNENSKYFGSGEYDKVVEYIVNKILEDDKIYIERTKEIEAAK